MTTNYYVTTTNIVKTDSESFTEEYDTTAHYSLGEAILDFNYRILGLPQNEDISDDEITDIKLLRHDNKCYMFYTTEDKTLEIFK